ncbi:MAG: 23S rRNA (pseudouridine(1915)-N(3))-methyltransferase RlmH [Candidatus Glassbacteria bacterium]
MMSIITVTPLLQEKDEEQVIVPLRITLLTVGKLKAKDLKGAFEDYLRRARRYFPIEVVEVKRGRYKSSENIDLVLKREKERLREKIQNGSYLIVLDENGLHLSTHKFAATLRELKLKGHQSVSFCLGGPFGLDDEIVNGADMKMALSKMTLPHELARVLLIEQIYRGGTILAGEKYHK